MLYTETVEPGTLGLLKRLMADIILESFVLVGGTALSLQLGHRKSIDLDLFSLIDFNSSEILSHLEEKNNNPVVIQQFKQTLTVEIEGIKLDFLHFRYPFTYNILNIDGIRMADIRDIACMKVDAIVGRGRKKDFYDLFYLLKRFSLEEIINWYQRMYNHSSLFHVYKSLTWFEDADMDAELNTIDQNYTWEKVKSAILTEVNKSL